MDETNDDGSKVVIAGVRLEQALFLLRAMNATDRPYHNRHMSLAITELETAIWRFQLAITEVEEEPAELLKKDGRDG